MRSKHGFQMAANKSEKNNEVTIYQHGIIVSLLRLLCCVSLVKFSYWSNFHVSIVIVTIYVYKGLTRNPWIGNTPVWFCPISRDWGKLGIPDLTRMSLIKRFWMLQNVRVNVYGFWVIHGKPRGDVKLITNFWSNFGVILLNYFEKSPFPV